MQKKPWIKLPTEWIRRYGLKDIKWGKEGGSSATAGLMILVALLHRVEGEDTGVARATYDALCEATGLSRTKVADGLRYLEMKQFITREPNKNSIYKVCLYPFTGGWAKFPCKGLYDGEKIKCFQDFKLRSRAELDALKLYFVIMAFVSNENGTASIGYDKISGYAGIPEMNIKSAISVLVFNHLINVENKIRAGGGYGRSHSYRPTYLDPRFYMQDASIIVDDGSDADPIPF